MSARGIVLTLYIALLVVGCTAAFAQQACDGSWVIVAGPDAGFVLPGPIAHPDFCANRLAAYSTTATGVTCVANGDGFIVAGTLTSGAPFSYDFQQQPIGCTSGQLSDAQALNFLAWAGVVAVFALGYVGGRIR